MAESHSKCRLKRKKTFVEDHQPEISFKGTLDRSRVLSGDLRSELRRSVAPAAVWWNREQLPDVESLWAQTLKSTLPYLENQLCDLVPDLPPSSTARSATVNLDEQRWCDLTEEVAPLPEPCPPSPRNVSSPGSLSLSSFQKDPSIKTKLVPNPPDRQLASHSKQNHNGKTTPFHIRLKKPSLRSWDGASSSTTGPSSIGRAEERKEGEQAKEPEQLNRKPLRNQLRGSDRQVSLHKKKENEEEVMEDKEEEMQRSVRGDGDAAGGGQLQSCPMCLLVFPAGFTQMDCDGHLAQCLSEVSVDVTW